MSTAIATFGRFNIIHNGHLALINTLLQNEGDVVVGLSTALQNRDSIARLADMRQVTEELSYTTYPVNNMYVFISDLCENYDTVVLYVGTDRFSQVQRLMRNFDNLEVRELPREENSHSSTRVRNIYRSYSSFTEFCDVALTEGLYNNVEAARVGFNAAQNELEIQ